MDILSYLSYPPRQRRRQALIEEWLVRQLPAPADRCCPIIKSGNAAEPPAPNENSDRQIPGISSRSEEFLSPHDFQLRQGPRPVRSLSVAARSRIACS